MSLCTCLCPHCKFEGVLVPGSEPLGLSLLRLLMLYIGSATWVSAGKQTANLSWDDDSCSPQPLCHGWTTSRASQLQAQARCCAWRWQLWGALSGGAAPPAGGLPWAVWAGGCSGQKLGLDSRLTLNWKDWVYWAVCGICDVKQITPWNKAKGVAHINMAWSHLEKNVFFMDLGLKCLGGLSCVSVLERSPKHGSNTMWTCMLWVYF